MLLWLMNLGFAGGSGIVNVWTEKTDSSDTWTEQSISADVWTKQDDSTDTWTEG